MTAQSKREFREGIDTALLIIAFIGGISLALILKAIGLPPWVPALASGTVIIIYAVTTYFSSSARLEPEQIGDNCYYLGFCITLASLAYTLYGLGSAGDNSAILADVISGFGVALSSTVVGVMTRVVLLQFRVDLAARDKEVRGQLNQVIRSFHGEMQTSVTSTREAITQIRQTLEEHTQDTIKNNLRLQESFDARIAEHIEEMVTDIKSAMSEVVDSGKDMNRRLSASSRANMSTAEKAMQESLESVTAELKRAAEQLELAMQRANGTSVKALERIVVEVSAAMKLVGEEAARSIKKSHNAQSDEMTKAVVAVGSNVFELANQIGAQKDKLGIALEGLSGQVEAVRNEAGDLLRESAASREDARKAAQVITVASQKMAWATEKMEEASTKFSLGVVDPRAAISSQPAPNAAPTATSGSGTNVPSALANGPEAQPRSSEPNVEHMTPTADTDPQPSSGEGSLSGELQAESADPTLSNSTQTRDFRNWLGRSK